MDLDTVEPKCLYKYRATQKGAKQMSSKINVIKSASNVKPAQLNKNHLAIGALAYLVLAPVGISVFLSALNTISTPTAADIAEDKSRAAAIHSRCEYIKSAALEYNDYLDSQPSASSMNTSELVNTAAYVQRQNSRMQSLAEQAQQYGCN
ncbi:MAG: hypothetical protein ACRC4J_00120 [Cetobacterium sp.]